MEEALIILKTDLGITSTVKDDYFTKLLETCLTELKNKGIILSLNNTEDLMLISDYAAWQYRKRQENVPISNNLQFRIRNRVVKARSVDTDAII